MEERWYKTAYRRNVIDMHITDWDDRFLSEFDPKTYVDMLVLSKVKSAVVYAHSHVGLCYFPTEVGYTHKGLKGRNILGEVIDLCHQNEINVVVYYSAIFDTWAYRNNPDWRIIDVNGEETAKQSRTGICCPNSPYRDYATGIAEEICKNFEFEGIRFDMTFWPAVCYCSHCQKRFTDEVGGEIPKVIHWENPEWVRFQRKREEWLVEFAELLTNTVKGIKPDVSVEHQASTYILNWRFGVTEKLAAQNDFLQGDFYGDALQGSFARKLFHNLSENLPFGFETSFCVEIANHTAKKPKELLEAKTYASLADGGAFVFIDGIDPVGTLNPRVYACMGEIFDEAKRYEPYLGGTLCQDVGVYLSTESKFDFADNGKSVDDPNLSTALPHVDAALNACQALIEHHIPFGVITKKNLDNLSRHQLLVLPNVLMLDEDEAEAIRGYVGNGGNVYASKYTSLITKAGTRKDDFLLADIFGVSFAGETEGTYSYIAPVERSETSPAGVATTEDLFAGYTEKHPLAFDASQMIVKAETGLDVLGKIVLPYTDPADWEHFASIHSNPPGINTDHPAVVLNRFGQGKVIYTTVDLENSGIYRDIFVNLIRLLFNAFSFEVDAPKPVEATAFHQEDKRRYILSLVNFQKELPNIPVSGIRARFRLRDRKVKRLISLPEEKELSYRVENELVEFCAPQLDTFLMFALDYE